MTINRREGGTTPNRRLFEDASMARRPTVNDLTPRETYWIGRWAHALRTTTAPQIQRHLHDEQGGRCAVGGLEDVLVMDGLLDGNHLVYSAQPCTDIAQRIAPGSQWFMSTIDDVTKLNDLLNLTFPEISDWLLDLLPRDTAPAVAEREAVLA